MSEKEIQDILDQLSALEPTPLDAPKPVSQALSQTRQQIHHLEKNHSPSLWQRFFSSTPTRRWAFAAALFLIFAFSFTFPSVRAAASEFLGLFRVQKFAAITISAEQIALLESLSEAGMYPGEVTIYDEPGERTPVDSLAKASTLSGISAPRTLPALANPESINVFGGGNGSMTIDLEGARAIVEATGNDPMLLPDSINGARIRVVAFPGIEQEWADGTWLLQTPSPLVEYPEDMGDQTVLAEAFLKVAGLSDTEAKRLARDIDWTSTLLLPLPANTVNFDEITVDGVSGMALQDIDSISSAIMWEKEGIIYLLQGKKSPSDLKALAAGME